MLDKLEIDLKSAQSQKEYFQFDVVNKEKMKISSQMDSTQALAMKLSAFMESESQKKGIHGNTLFEKGVVGSGEPLRDVFVNPSLTIADIYEIFANNGLTYESGNFSSITSYSPILPITISRAGAMSYTREACLLSSLTRDMGNGVGVELPLST